MASVRFADLQSRPTECPDFTSVMLCYARVTQVSCKSLRGVPRWQLLV